MLVEERLLGFAIGILFGALVQKGAIARFEKQVGLLLFRDFTVFRFSLAAIGTGMLCGALFYTHAYGYLTRTLLAWIDFGDISIPDATGVPAKIVMGMALAAILLSLRKVDGKTRARKV